MTGQTHILIAEDEERLLNSMQFLFHGKGYRVTKTRTGTDALQIVKICHSEGTPIDLLITDIQMPGMDGESLIRAVREFDISMPVLVMTGFGHKEMVIRLMHLGCNDYIDKPFGLDQMEAHVESLLEKSRLDAADKRQLAQMKFMEEKTRSLGHDLNNMMNVTLCYTELAMNSLDDSHPAKKRLSKALASANAAEDIAQRLFHLKKHISSAVTRPTELRAVVDGAASILRSYAPENITVGSVADDQPIWLVLNAEQIRQALLNLGKNAIDAMADGGTISFATTIEESRRVAEEPLSMHACVSVSDTGPGLSPEQLSKMFKEEFTTKAHGHGYGLLAVKAVVEECNGWIVVENGENGGAEFKLYFPLERSKVR
ncbi:MAG: response regulator [Ignavibacteriales bacterium]|nr:response regulator [Ignavibacteriales bacterium]